MLVDDTKKMRESGASEEFVAIYEAAARMGDKLLLINFDRDADRIEGLPTFDW